MAAEPSTSTSPPQQRATETQPLLASPRAVAHERTPTPTTAAAAAAAAAAAVPPHIYKLRVSAAVALCPAAAPSPSPDAEPAAGGAPAPAPAVDARRDAELPADARAELALARRTALGCAAFAALGALWVFALPLSAAALLWAFARLRRWRRQRPQRTLLHAAATLLSLVAALLLLCAFAAAVAAAATADAAQTTPVRAAVYWWGVAIVPATYPFLIAAVVCFVLAFRGVEHTLRAAAWRAVERAIAQSQLSVVRHYRISHYHKIVAATAAEAQIAVAICPDAAVREQLVAGMGVSEALLEDALDPVQEARVEFHNGHMGAVIRMVAQHIEVEDSDELKNSFRVCSCGVFLFADKLVVVLSEARPLFEGRQFAHVETLPDVLVRLLRSFTHGFETTLKRINEESDRLEEDIDNATSNHALMENFALQKSLVYHTNALSSNGAVLARMSERLQLSPHSVALLGEVIAENTQCQKMAELFLSVISGLIASRSSLISNNLNVAMKNLNSVAISMSVVTFLSGVGGMSEFSAAIGFDKHWKLGYSMFILGSLILATIIFFLLVGTESLWARTRKSPKRKRK